MKLEKLVEDIIYDSGVERELSMMIASNIMSTFRNFMYENYIKPCQEHNGMSSCKNCGLSLDDII